MAEMRAFLRVLRMSPMEEPAAKVYVEATRQHRRAAAYLLPWTPHGPLCQHKYFCRGRRLRQLHVCGRAPRHGAGDGDQPCSMARGAAWCTPAEPHDAEAQSHRGRARV